MVNVILISLGLDYNLLVKYHVLTAVTYSRYTDHNVNSCNKYFMSSTVRTHGEFLFVSSRLTQQKCGIGPMFG